jgi:ubiquinone/menaquinone biosynthesis C-methylase UbiE
MEISKDSKFDDYYNYYNNNDDQMTEENGKRFKVASDLIDLWYRKPRKGDGKTPEEGRTKKMLKCYEGEEVTGLGIELAFGFGTSTHWLMERYDNIVMDGLDFQAHFINVAKFLKELYGDKIGDYSIGDIQTTGKPDNHYDFINSSSVWEHLTEDVYWNTLNECYRILKPGGRIYVYADQGPKGGEHIRVVPPEVTRKEMEKVGFKAITNYIYTK